MVMHDFERIREIKRAAQGRLLALPGVHSVAIGAKIVAGQRTKEPAIVVFVTRKKEPSDLPASEMIPTEIDGVKTDVVEEEMPHLLAVSLPDTTEYDVMEGGIQIQAGTSVTGLGTLGCIARTDEPQPRIVALTCQHVVATWGPVPTGIQVQSSADKHEATFWGTNVPGTQVSFWVNLTPTGGGGVQGVAAAPTITTNADTPATIASKIVAALNAVANPNLTLTTQAFDSNMGPAAKLTATAGAGF